MELKLCEMGCGRTFLRTVPLSAKKGQKWCKACGAMSPEQREHQYEDYRSRELRAMAGVM
jgi:hypothetical protein